MKQFQTLRSKLPETASLVVMKNSLLEKAIEGTKFEALKPCMTGMNAFLFVHTDEIPPALKVFRSVLRFWFGLSAQILHDVKPYRYAAKHAQSYSG